jgi:hypothetical protein
LFEEFEMIFFPIGKQNRPIQSLVSAVGAVSIGDGESEQGPLAIFVLSRAEWERVNVGFIAEYEAEAAVRDGMQRTLETIFHEAESPVFARVAEEDE